MSRVKFRHTAYVISFRKLCLHLKKEQEMKKIIVLFFLAVFLSGCASYRFQRAKEPYDNKGYVALRDDYLIPEYTIGKNNSVPDLQLAKERFKKRKNTVEHYYKKMGYIENHFKMAFWDPCIFFLKIIGGVFRLPSVAIADYRYEHDPEYKEKIRKIEDERDAKEEAHIQKLKEELNIYIQQELTKENP
jgi:hypothetical protein